MKKHMIIAATILVSGIGTAGINSAYAASDSNAADKAEMQALMSAKLTAEDAIKAVTAQQQGKIAELQFDLEKEVPAFEVTILATDGTEHDFMVDASSGAVTKIAANEDKNAEEGNDEDSNEDGENGNN